MKIYLCLLVLIVFASIVEAAKQKPKKKPPKKPPVHLSNSTKIGSKFTRGSLLRYLAKGVTLWESKYISAAKKQWYKRLLGGFFPTKHDLNIASRWRLNQTENTFMHQEYEEVPFEFDAREQWTRCKSIGEIQDQTNCSASWAVASAATMSDRACIGSNGERQPRISAIDLMSCCVDCKGTAGDGCVGGYGQRAWEFYTNRGLVTTECRPYLFEDSGTKESEYHSPQCKTQCKNKKEYYNDKHYGADVVYPDTMESIQQEIYTNGPVIAQIEVHEDLIGYQSGVYNNRHGSLIGGHVVRILGWGEEKGVPYWLIANTWGKDWGQKGTFKMIRGINHLNVEQFAVGGTYDYLRSAETTRKSL